MTKRPWSAVDDEYLREHHGRVKNQKIAYALERTLAAVQMRTAKLGLATLSKRGGGRPWTTREDDYLRAHFGERTARQLSRVLDRTQSAVQLRVGKLGLTAPVEQPWTPTPAEIERSAAEIRKGWAQPDEQGRNA
jgi:hypothetical protein